MSRIHSTIEATNHLNNSDKMIQERALLMYNIYGSTFNLRKGESYYRFKYTK
jgi:hypothetical protein